MKNRALHYPLGWAKKMTLPVRLDIKAMVTAYLKAATAADRCAPIADSAEEENLLSLRRARLRRTTEKKKRGAALKEITANTAMQAGRIAHEQAYPMKISRHPRARLALQSA